MFNLGIIGPSSFSDTEFFTKELNKIKPKIKSIVSGDAKGVEALAESYATRNNIPINVLYHSTTEKGARLILNNEIVKSSDALLVFWDSENKSIISAINMAIALRKHVKVIYTDFAKKDILLKKDFGFQGNQRWLSNMFPCEIDVGKWKFMSVEAAYQASKYNHSDRIVKNFQNLPAIISKKYNQYLKAGQVPIQKNFEDNKLKIMNFLLRKKFENPYLREKLVLTKGRDLVEENNWHDTFWGVCHGEGQNNLGKILMRIRDEL